MLCKPIEIYSTELVLYFLHSITTTQNGKKKEYWTLKLKRNGITNEINELTARDEKRTRSNIHTHIHTPYYWEKAIPRHGRSSKKSRGHRTDTPEQDHNANVRIRQNQVQHNRIFSFISSFSWFIQLKIIGQS